MHYKVEPVRGLEIVMVQVMFWGGAEMTECVDCLTQGATDLGTVGNFGVDDNCKAFDMFNPVNVSMK